MSNTNSRAPKRTMKFDAATLIASIEGIGEIDGAAITEAVRTDLFGVGLMTMLARAKHPKDTYREMCAGTWGKRGSAAPAGKPLSPWDQATVSVRVEDWVRAKKSGGEKVSASERAEMTRRADAWVRGLTKEQRVKVREVAEVRIEHAKLTGSAILSLDDALAEAQASAYARPEDDDREAAA